MLTRLLAWFGIQVRRTPRVSVGDTIQFSVGLIDMWLEDPDKRSMQARVSGIVQQEDGSKLIIMTNHPPIPS